MFGPKIVFWVVREVKSGDGSPFGAFLAFRNAPKLVFAGVENLAQIGGGTILTTWEGGFFFETLKGCNFRLRQSICTIDPDLERACKGKGLQNPGRSLKSDGWKIIYSPSKLRPILEIWTQSDKKSSRYSEKMRPNQEKPINPKIVPGTPFVGLPLNALSPRIGVFPPHNNDHLKL